MSGETECDTTEGGYSGCQDVDDPIVDIFDYNACCINTIKWRTCDDGSYGDNPEVLFEKFDFSDEEWSGCDSPAGNLLITALPSYDYAFPYIISWNMEAYDFPYDMIGIQSNPTIAEQAGYDISTNPGDIGVVTGGGIVKYDRITLLENQTYRRGNSYCDHNVSNHMDGVTFTCDGDQPDDWVNVYGTYTIEDIESDTFITLNEHPINQDSLGTISVSETITSSNPNDYGNPCVTITGTGTKYNGRQFNWDTNIDGNCVSVGSDVSDVGFDFSIPQGDGDNANGDTPYNGFIPTHGLKILKSFPAEEFGDMFWWDRSISIYYLSSDGRFMTEGGSLGVYELNRKDETLKLIGLTKSARCRDGGTGGNIIDQYDNMNDCIDNGYRWYESSNTIIEIDNTGFQDSIIVGTIRTPYVTYLTNEDCDESPCARSDPYEIGQIKSLPAKFSSSTIWEGTYAGSTPSTFYINGDDQNDFIALIRNRMVDSQPDSGADFGYSMVRTFVGQLGLDGDDSWGNWQLEQDQGIFPTNASGDAWGWASYKTFYGYGYHESFANAASDDTPWNPNNPDEGQIWKHKQIGHRMRFQQEIDFENSSNPSYDTISQDSGINANILFQYFSPLAPCDCNYEGNPSECSEEFVNCQGEYYGVIVDGDLDANSSYGMGGEVCDLESNWFTCTGADDDPIQCDFEGEVVNTCIGCMDPSAINYCVPYGCTYSDFSCVYEVPGDEDGLLCDANGDGTVNILDITSGIQFILSGNADEWPFIYNMDYDGDGLINILDIISCVGYILGGGDGTMISTPNDGQLLKILETTLDKPNGLRSGIKLLKKHGYNSRKVKDYMKIGNKIRKKGKTFKRLQNSKTKSKKVRNNLIKSNRIVKKITGKR
jgi:hypothetical protein